MHTKPSPIGFEAFLRAAADIRWSLDKSIAQLKRLYIFRKLCRLRACVLLIYGAATDAVETGKCIYQITARETDHRPTDRKSDRAEDRDRKSF